ncbi:20890_t:CDS:2 [Rhizophagus irregularis]|nr:20890_t:CDS:2 [Rhizophagus irregularis]
MSIDGTRITLWCFVQGSSSIFKVKIGTNNDIDDLKKAIKSCGVINVASISDISEEMLNDDNELEDERSTIANTFFGIKERNIQLRIYIQSGKWGGIPRYVLERANDVTHHNEAIKGSKGDIFDDIVENDNKDENGKIPYTIVTIKFASDYVKEQVTDQLEERIRERLLEQTKQA